MCQEGLFEKDHACQNWGVQMRKRPGETDYCRYTVLIRGWLLRTGFIVLRISRKSLWCPESIRSVLIAYIQRDVLHKKVRTKQIHTIPRYSQYPPINYPTLLSVVLVIRYPNSWNCQYFVPQARISIVMMLYNHTLQNCDTRKNMCLNQC